MVGEEQEGGYKFFEEIIKMKGGYMDIEIARGIAARIWCDFEYKHMDLERWLMNVDLAEEIAQKFCDYANQETQRTEGR